MRTFVARYNVGAQAEVTERASTQSRGNVLYSHARLCFCLTRDTLAGKLASTITDSLPHELSVPAIVLHAATRDPDCDSFYVLAMHARNIIQPLFLFHNAAQKIQGNRDIYIMEKSR